MLWTVLNVDSACEAISGIGIGVGVELGLLSTVENCRAPAVAPAENQQKTITKPARICRCTVNNPAFQNSQGLTPVAEILF